MISTAPSDPSPRSTPSHFGHVRQFEEDAAYGGIRLQNSCQQGTMPAARVDDGCERRKVVRDGHSPGGVHRPPAVMAAFNTAASSGCSTM